MISPSVPTTQGERRRLCWCGVYVDCHQRIDHKPRKAPRLRVWFINHSLWLHMAAPIWLRIPSKRRWDIVTLLNRSSRRCWCDLVSNALAEPKDDPCDASIPWPTGTRGLSCASVCDYSHNDHKGEHPCQCYCGKFQFTATEGYLDRKDATDGRRF